MSIDLRAILRRLKPEKRIAPLMPRPVSELTFAAHLVDRGRAALVPDTNIYILNSADRLAPQVVALLDGSLQFHCSVCLSELSIGVANYSPVRDDWPKVRELYADLFATVPDHRILVPDEEIWISAGVIAGTLARTQTFQPHQRKQCLNDALIYLTAAKAGIPLLTTNRLEFDLIEQLAPGGTVLHV